MRRETEIRETRIRAVAGGEISGCIREAASLCLERGEPVLLTHNGKVYTADPKAIIEAVFRTAC